MNEPQTETGRKAFKYKHQPTPAQELVLNRLLLLCRWLYNSALEQRLTWRRRRQGQARGRAGAGGGRRTHLC